VAASIVVRPYRLPADAEALVRIFDESWQHHEDIDPKPRMVPRSLDVIRRRFAAIVPDPDRALLVAEVDGEVVGLAEARMRRDESSGFVGAYVEELAVTVAWRGRGVGTRLMAEVERWARQHGARSVALDTMETNAGARRLYERLGYTTRAVIMAKRFDRE
jgi:ribosomal protein S18 acetylase RimI-like enzyme